MMSAPRQPFLDRRTTTSHFRVKDLLEELRQGRLRLPDFQRPLRWGPRQNLDLLDSVLRGYPIGALLLWEREAPAGLVRLGPFETHAPAHRHAWWIVDGQQRLTALAGALLVEEHADTQHRPVFDLEFEAILPARNAPNGVPLPVLTDRRRLYRWLRDHDLDDALAQRAEEASERILEYSIPAYVVETSDASVVRDIFTRINTAGVSMRADEVFSALHGPSEARPSGIDLTRLGLRALETGFGAIPRTELMKVALATSGLDPHRPPTGTSHLVAEQDAVEAALLAAIGLVQVEAAVGHFRLLPYPAALYTLARFFHLHPNPHPVTRTRLARWFWRAAATSAFGRPAASRWRDSVRAIDSDEHASVDRLMRGLPARPDAPWALSRFDGRIPTSRMEMLALLSLGPLPLPRSDVFREGSVELADLVGRDRLASEVFPGAHGEEDRALAKSAANRVLLEVSLGGRRAAALPADPESPFYVSHAIPPQSAVALRRGDKPAFLRSRAHALVELMESFLERHAGWDEPDLPPLDTFLEEE